MSRALASRVMRSATSRTWPTEPAAPVSSAACSVWTESIDADLRALGVDRREHGVQVGLRQHRHLERRAGQPLGAQPDLRRRLLAGDVQRPPAGALRGCRAPSRSASTCRCRASRRSARASRAPARRPARGRAPRSPSRSRTCRAACDGRERDRLHRPRARRAAASPPARAPPAGARTSSASVFHSPQPGHCPSHRGASAPQAEQTKTVVERAMAFDDIGAARTIRPPAGALEPRRDSRRLERRLGGVVADRP